MFSDLIENESKIFCLKIAKSITVGRPHQKPYCPLIRIFLSIGNIFELIIFVKIVGIIDILDISQ